MSRRQESSRAKAGSATAKNPTAGIAATQWACSKATGKCLNPHCAVMCTVARGLCRNCYKMALDHVNAKRTTWEAMEKAGKCRPPMNSHQMGPRRAWFLTGGPDA